MATDYNAAAYGVSADTNALLNFEANKKSVGVAYVLLFFFGGLGGHRFYLAKTETAVAQLILTIVGWLSISAGVGVLPLAANAIWVMCDIFLIPKMVRNFNSSLAMGLGGSHRPRSSDDPDPELSDFVRRADETISRYVEEQRQAARRESAGTASRVQFGKRHFGAQL